MNEDTCEWSGCGSNAVVALEGRPLCQRHFHEMATKRLEAHQEGLRHAALTVTQGAAVLKFLSEVISHATTLVVREKSLSPNQRDQLHQLSRSALMLYQRIQRNPRLPLRLPIVFHRESGLAGNMELTNTVNVSKRGACIATSSACIIDEKLWVQKTASSLRALARVVWTKQDGPANFRAGIELLKHENFWGLSSAGPPASRTRSPKD